MSFVPKTVNFLVLTGVLALLSYFFFRFFWGDSKPLLPVNVAENFDATQTSTQITPKMVNSLALENTVIKAMSGADGHYAIAIKNLKTGESYFVNEHEKFPSASLYKLWVMATVFDSIKQGKLNPETKLSANVADLNREFNIDDESADLTEGAVNMTVSTALEQMIVISHNYAAMLLTDEVGVASLSAKMKAIGESESNLGQPPMTTASDIEIFFEKLYRGQIADPKNTKQMIELLSRQQLNNGIPRFLPKGIMTAHKTGEIGLYKHNAGIVSTPNNDYIIVVLSQSNFPDGAQERIGIISKAVYDYFESTSSN